MIGMGWETDRLPTGPGLVKRHGALDVNWDDPRNSGSGTQGPPGPAGPTGPQGPAGPAGQDGQDITYRGDWVTGTAYALQDVVRYTAPPEGLRTFICTSPLTSTVAPPSDGAHWEVMTESGQDGTDGTNGAPGPAGPSYIPDGTDPAAPGLPVQSDPNTGLFAPAADTLAVATAGIERLRVDSAGNVGIGGTGTASQALHVERDGTTVFVLRQNSTDALPPTINIGKRRGTRAAPVIVNSGDQLSAINFYGYDGATNVIAARILSQVDGTPGANDMPGLLAFYTTPDGSAANTERMRIANDGLITGTGPSLGAWVAYTPAVGGFTRVDGTASGRYCRMGKTVYFRAWYSIGANDTKAGNPTLSPPVPISTAGGAATTFLSAMYLDVSVASYFGQANPGATDTILFYIIGTNGQRTQVSATVPFAFGTGDVIYVSGTYEAA